MIGPLPLGFAQPLVLLGLLSLPVLWWLLRVTPPAPRRAASIAARCASVSSSEVKDLLARPALASAIVIEVKSVIY